MQLRLSARRLFWKAPTPTKTPVEALLKTTADSTSSTTTVASLTEFSTEIIAKIPAPTAAIAVTPTTTTTTTTSAKTVTMIPTATAKTGTVNSLSHPTEENNGNRSYAEPTETVNGALTKAGPISDKSIVSSTKNNAKSEVRLKRTDHLETQKSRKYQNNRIEPGRMPKSIWNELRRFKKWPSL